MINMSYLINKTSFCYQVFLVEKKIFLFVQTYFMTLRNFLVFFIRVLYIYCYIYSQLFDFLWLWTRFFILICYWSIVGLQCCFNFCCIAKWSVCTQIFSHFFPFFHFIIFHYGLSWDAECRTLLFIHPIYTSLHLLIPIWDKWSFLSPFIFLLNVIN